MQLSDSAKIAVDTATGIAPLGTAPVALGVNISTNPMINEIAVYAGLIAAALSIILNGAKIYRAVCTWLKENEDE